jgi:enoyl-[acyl-carrier protein] reductase II
MIKTALTELVGIDYPIVQGGMAWVATWQLAAAVSEGGALGIVGAGNAPVDWVREQIRQTRAHTSRPFGVNIPLFSPVAEQVIQLVIEEQVPVLTTGAGNPTPYVEALKAAGVIVIPVVASAALARRLERLGVDAVIAEGEESGGHIGSVTTMSLVPQVADAVSIPVIAAGGVGDGRGLVAALALGAVGVQMGTRFVCTDECIAHLNYKQSIVKANERATLVTGFTIGHPVRCLRNPMSREFESMEKAGVEESQVVEFGTGRLQLAAIKGDVQQGTVMAGQISGLVHDILPAAELIQRINAEAEALLARMPHMVVSQEVPA